MLLRRKKRERFSWAKKTAHGMRFLLRFNTYLFLAPCEQVRTCCWHLPSLVQAQTREYLFPFLFFVSLLLSSFCTSCGLRCHSFPPARAFSFLSRIRRVQHSHCSSTFTESC